MKEISVLIVEDDPMVQEINKRFIAKLKDFRVLAVASHGEEALKMLETVKPQLILLDIFMPRVDGLTTLKEIRKRGVNSDVILITADKSVQTVQEAIRYGVVDYIIKPFKFDRFKEALQNYKRFKEKLQETEVFQQKDLDSILYASQEQEENPLPKGLNQVTLDSILNYLRQHTEYLTSMELAQAVGIARVTARRYMEYLAEKRIVDIELEYGSVGRPIHKFRISEDQNSISTD
ncbi:response regulator [Geosporobacter ferrireducens]|uniref:Transcriptional regulatory protein n=1 Tax=Geosporobacter ferrireducens TaxID=1424294 RepID=A0A1D8GDW0_9FIRM|nr:response regulator [Geosporobacter ferrireducens]AOT69091.1 two-component system response regulator [Geosporobacter ferrireducens]MTI56764.1 response regulator [Geosporobacter ferrireducens]